MGVQTAVDIAGAEPAYPSFGGGEVPCLFCKFELPLRWFGRLVTMREGMAIVHCECPMCERTWRRVECGEE